MSRLILAMMAGPQQVPGTPNVGPISPHRLSNGWIQNGGWCGKILALFFLYMCTQYWLTDGSINPPHFYITHEEAQHALQHHTGLTKHPGTSAP